MTDTNTVPTDDDRDPQHAGGRAEAGDGHRLAEKDRAAAQAEGDDASDTGTDSTSGGQVSNVNAQSAADPDTPLSDSQSVAGNPTDESGETQEPEEAGPNAKPGGNVESNRRA